MVYLSDVLTDRHNCTSKQLFFKKHLNYRYNFKKLETSISTYNVNIEMMSLTGTSDRI